MLLCPGSAWGHLLSSAPSHPPRSWSTIFRSEFRTFSPVGLSHTLFKRQETSEVTEVTEGALVGLCGDAGRLSVTVTEFQELLQKPDTFSLVCVTVM